MNMSIALILLLNKILINLKSLIAFNRSNFFISLQASITHLPASSNISNSFHKTWSLEF